MNNKQRIKKIRDYAELAQASYFYFDLLKDSNGIPRKIYELDSNGNKIKDEKYPRGYKEVAISLEHIVSKEYRGQEALINLKQDDTWKSNLLNTLDEKTNFDQLNGEFNPLQAQNFAKRYKICFHQPNTKSGFSATLFSEKRKQKNTESKAIQYTSEYGYINYILAIRGTELNNKGDIGADTKLALGNIPKKQHLDMLLFYNQCIGKILFYVERDSKEYIESRKVA